jgi:hypothetical protein
MRVSRIVEFQQAIDVNISLREGDNNIVFLEKPRDLKSQRAAYTARAALRCGLNPEEGIEYQGGISKILENDR